MRVYMLRFVLVLSGLFLACAPLDAQSMMGQQVEEFRPQTKSDAVPTEISPKDFDQVLQTQAAEPMPGGGAVPFTLDQSGDVAPVDVPAMNATANRFNYSAGSPATVFASPSFAEPQAGASGENRPGAFRNTNYRWYGFVRLDGIYDFKPIGSTDSFVTSTIPVPQGEGQNSVLTPRYTRLGFDTSTDLNDWDVNTRIEMDFFNGNTSGAFGSFPIRLRFAWIEYGPLLIGQAASVFMDYDVFPNVLDYQGPNGMILMRQPIARLKLPVLSDNNTVSLAVEQPYSDIQWEQGGTFTVNPGTGIITDPTAFRNEQDMPDFTSNVRHDGDYGHVQLAGIVRRLAFREGNGPDFAATGYGASLTGIFHPFAWLSGVSPTDKCAGPLAKSRIIGQYADGRGINRYFQDPNGLGLDAVFTPATGFQAIDSRGGFVAYEQWWAGNWASVFSYSMMDEDLPAVLPGSTYQRGQYASANLIWLPFDRMGVGVEFLYGERQNKDGQTGEAFRLQSAVQYKF